MRVTGPGKDLTFVNSDASLIVGTLAVPAGSLSLSESGVVRMAANWIWSPALVIPSDADVDAAGQCQ
jgi:hypothetical protein